MPSTSRTRNYSEFVRIQTTAMPVRKWCHFASSTMPLRRLPRRAHNPHHWSRVECDCWHRFSWTVEITNVIEGEDNGRKEKVSNSLQCWERATIRELIETDLFTGWWLIYNSTVRQGQTVCVGLQDAFRESVFIGDAILENQFGRETIILSYKRNLKIWTAG